MKNPGLCPFGPCQADDLRPVQWENKEAPLEIIHHILPLPEDAVTQKYFTDKTAFFDIETTGFSPGKNFVYLIGLVTRQGNSMETCQFFAENHREEGRILTAFHEAANSVDTFICFNGLRFDVPFLKQRETHLQLSFSRDISPGEDFSFLDLYRTARTLAPFLSLPNQKQKTLESFLGTERKDRYTGGELISIYRQYEKQPADEAKSLLLLHNYEDILGMAKLLPLLSYCEFLRAVPAAESASLEETRPYGSTALQKELQILLKAPFSFPRQVFFEKDFFRLICRKESAYLSIPVLEGELLFYYDNYKDYYYLPEEDMAVHKSVASFVDKSHRKKATPDTCYTKRRGVFLPQASHWFSPCFYPGKKGKSSYFEYQEGFLSDFRFLSDYAKNILALCYTPKHTRLPDDLPQKP